MQQMKRWQLSEFGLENLQLAEVEIPNPAKHEVLIKVKAVSLNYRDKLVIEGCLLPGSPQMPFTPVSDMAGEVVELGDGVSRVTVGELVIANFWTQWIDAKAPKDMISHGQSMGGPLPGVLAQYIVVHEDFLVKSPGSLTPEESSTLPVAGLTAWFALWEKGNVHQGENVLVQGTGGVSLFGMQIARALGANVIVTSRSEDKIKAIKALGITSVINTGLSPNWAEEALKLTKGEGVDHILELIGGDNLRQSVNALAPDGNIFQIGFMRNSELAMPAVPFMLRRAVIQGITVGHRRALEELCEFIDKHKIKPIIYKVYNFDQAKDAFAQLEAGAFGKIVIRVN